MREHVTESLVGIVAVAVNESASVWELVDMNAAAIVHGESPISALTFRRSKADGTKSRCPRRRKPRRWGDLQSGAQLGPLNTNPLEPVHFAATSEGISKTMSQLSSVKVRRSAGPLTPAPLLSTVSSG